MIDIYNPYPIILLIDISQHIGSAPTPSSTLPYIAKCIKHESNKAYTLQIKAWRHYLNSYTTTVNLLFVHSSITFPWILTNCNFFYKCWMQKLIVSDMCVIKIMTNENNIIIIVLTHVKWLQSWCLINTALFSLAYIVINNACMILKIFTFFSLRSVHLIPWR